MQLKCGICHVDRPLAPTGEETASFECARCDVTVHARRRLARGTEAPATASQLGRPWHLRDPRGAERGCDNTLVLQQWIVSGQVTRNWDISADGVRWKPIAGIIELAPLFRSALFESAPLPPPPISTHPNPAQLDNRRVEIDADDRDDTGLAGDDHDDGIDIVEAAADEKVVLAEADQDSFVEADTLDESEVLLDEVARLAAATRNALAATVTSSPQRPLFPLPPPTEEVDRDLSTGLSEPIHKLSSLPSVRRSRTLARTVPGIIGLLALGAVAAYFLGRPASADHGDGASQPGPVLGWTMTGDLTAFEASSPSLQPAPATVGSPQSRQSLSSPEPRAEPPSEPARAVEPAASTSSRRPAEDYASLVERGNQAAVEGDCRHAVQLFRRALTLRADDAAALTGLGYCELDRGGFDQARSRFRAALATAPDAEDALLGIAESYHQQGDHAAAIAGYRAYLTAHPNGPRAKLASHQLEELGGLTARPSPPPAPTSTAADVATPDASAETSPVAEPPPREPASAARPVATDTPHPIVAMPRLAPDRAAETSAPTVQLTDDEHPPGLLPR